jgi:hypothetical protein
VLYNVDPSDKRDGMYVDEFQGRRVYRSRPHYGMSISAGRMEWIPSTPYEKRFGMDDPWSDEYKAQLGENPDGMVADILSWVLMGE